ncbi:MAG: helix-turn-helix domain-containing protein [Chloroflexota bacterium]|nr:helix-turn-helix domain-containing protein [Chloroflexota bacterium]
METAAYFPMPPRLLATLKRLQALDDDELLEPTGAVARDRAAVESWQSSILEICQEFWPIDDFPHTMGEVGHPARQFVGLCLLHDPRTVPEGTILSHRMRPIRVPYDPQRPQDNPIVRAKDAELVALRGVLERAVQTRQVLEPHDIQRALAQATAAAIAGSLSALAELDYDPNVGHWFMPIPPDITSSDWRDAEESALRIDGRQPGDFVMHRVVYHHSRGESKRAIARRLGITPHTVSHHLDRFEHSTTR